jgi:hypothetical protein
MVWRKNGFYLIVAEKQSDTSAQSIVQNSKQDRFFAVGEAMPGWD